MQRLQVLSQHSAGCPGRGTVSRALNGDCRFGVCPGIHRHARLHRILGQRKAVLYGGIIIACGHFSMAFPTITTFYAGLVLIVLGTGLLKPNVSVIVGQLYGPKDQRRDAGFSIFYMGIKLGAFLAPLVTAFLAQSPFFREHLRMFGFNPAHSWH